MLIGRHPDINSIQSRTKKVMSARLHQGAIAPPNDPAGLGEPRERVHARLDVDRGDLFNVGSLAPR
jgi:hypothetical protein